MNLIEKRPKRNTMVEKIYAIIIEAIKDETLQPGQRLRQEELAADLQVSSRTVREAFKQLLADGVLVSEPYKGVRVAEMSLCDQIQLYEMRLMLETKAIERAAQTMTDKQLKKMRELLPFTAVNEREMIPLSQIRENNREFHLIYIRASGLNQYIPLLERIWELIFTFFSQKESSSQDYKEFEKVDAVLHAEILAALEKRDAKLASEKLAEHINHYLMELYQMFELQNQNQ